MKYETFLKSLNKLLSEIEENVLEDEQRVANLRKVWIVGRDIYRFKTESGYTVKQIAGDVGMSAPSLSKFVRAYQFFPDKLNESIEGKPVSWAHYSAILYLRSKEERNFYLREAAVNGWSSHEMRDRIRNNYFENQNSLKSLSKGHKKTARLKDKGHKLYFYSAKVLKVVDGDTLLLQVDVGFKIVMEHKVRLRGINCAEAKTELGEKAKAFVIQRLTTCEGADGNVVVKSYKAGKFGRYIVDIWYMVQETDKEKILKEGRFLNQELVDEGLAVLTE